MKAYFHRLGELTPTIFWVNNPTRAEAELAIANGAIGCTNNPSYPQKMIDHPLEGEYALNLLDESIRGTDTDTEAEIIFQQALVKPIAEKFYPIFQRTNGEHGYVSIQGDPIHEEDPDTIIREAFRNRAVCDNIACKVPTTAPGLIAMETLFAENVSVNATEIMSIQQAVDLFELYEKVTARTGKHPKLFMSHIAGIFDDYLQKKVHKDKIDVSSDILWQAGLVVARKLYKLMQERGYPGTFVAGGARGLHHFTEMVGGDVVITINWSGTADKLIEQDPPVVYRLFNPTPQPVIDELLEKIPDFKKAYLEDGIKVEEYEEFGPVVHFRNSFVKSWNRVLDVIAERRASV
jgi:transaldolase